MASLFRQDIGIGFRPVAPVGVGTVERPAGPQQSAEDDEVEWGQESDCQQQRDAFVNPQPSHRCVEEPEAEKQVDAPCSGGCKVKLENGDEYELKGGETVSIDGGVMFIDHSPDADIKDIPDIDTDAPAQ